MRSRICAEEGREERVPHCAQVATVCPPRPSNCVIGEGAAGVDGSSCAESGGAAIVSAAALGPFAAASDAEVA